MTRKLARWLQPFIPRYGLEIFFGGAATTFAVEWTARLVGRLGSDTAPHQWNQMVGFRGWFMLTLFGWGVWRACLINPAYAVSYRRWLETTPWTPDKSLPLGEVQLVWNDWLLLIAASLICWHWPLSWYAPLSFLLPYALLLTIVNYRAGQDWHALAAVALAALLPLALMHRETPWFSTILGVSIANVATTGWRRSLGSFPWSDSPRWKNFSFDRQEQTSQRPICRWWPLVHPEGDFRLGPTATWRETAMTAGLWGWLAGVVVVTLSHLGIREIPPQSDGLAFTLDVSAILTFIIGLSAATLRVMRYMPWCLPPISAIGRITTRRWLIPGYDRVFLAPAAVVLVAATLPVVLNRLGAAPAATAFLGTAAAVFTAIGTGPTLATWRLTGEYRMPTRMPADARHHKQSDPAGR